MVYVVNVVNSFGYLLDIFANYFIAFLFKRYVDEWKRTTLFKNIYIFHF